MASKQFPLSTNFDPAFGDVAEKMRAAAEAQGIKTHYESGVRSKDDQAQLYANFQAGRAGKPLPYPDRGRVPLAAVPGTSLHERGLAADIVADDPSQQAKLRAIGNQFGLVTKGTADPDHFEIASANIPKGGGTPGTYAYSGGPQPGGVQVASADDTPIGVTPPVKPVGTTVNAPSAPVAGALAAPAANPKSPYGNPFLNSLAQIESNNRNIPSTVDKDYPGQPGSKSQGYFQIDTPTWLQFAAKNGIDTVKYPNAMSAPPEVQAQVASQIPLGRFGGRTQKMLGQQFGTLDKTATIGSLASKYGGGAAAPAAPGVVDPSIVARGGVSPALPSDGAPAAAPAAAPADQPWWQTAYGKIVSKPVDAQGRPTGDKSPMESLSEAFAKGPARMKALEEDQAPESVRNYTGTPPPARNVSTGLQNVAQTYGTTLNSFLQPLTWSSAPPKGPQMAQAGLLPSQGGQVPGMSLNSFQPSAQGLGYGIDPVGYGYG